MYNNIFNCIHNVNKINKNRVGGSISLSHSNGSPLPLVRFKKSPKKKQKGVFLKCQVGETKNL